MSAVSTPVAASRVTRFYESTVGKKAIMAVTGVIGFGFVVGHLIGNLQFYLGPEVLNAYGATLRRMGALLWVVRGALLVTLVIHVTAAIQLWLLNRRARPVGYQRWSATTSSYASRTMILTGPILFFFIWYHLMHLTWGVAHPDFAELPAGTPDVYHNVVAGFSQPLAAAAYIVAMACLGYHLVHGVWSMFQSVGWNHPRYTPVIKKLATVVAALIVAGNISIPVSVLLGFYQR